MAVGEIHLDSLGDDLLRKKKQMLVQLIGNNCRRDARKDKTYLRTGVVTGKDDNVVCCHFGCVRVEDGELRNKSQQSRKSMDGKKLEASKADNRNRQQVQRQRVKKNRKSEALATETQQQRATRGRSWRGVACNYLVVPRKGVPRQSIARAKPRPADVGAVGSFSILSVIGLADLVYGNS